MADKTTYLEENLNKSQLLLNTMLERIDTNCLLFTWSIKNYSKLRKNVFYWKCSVGVKYTWKFKLLKARGTLFTVLSSNAINKLVYFSLLSKKGLRMQGGMTVEIADGLYVAEFCRKAIENVNFLEEDELTVQCRYEIKSDEGRILVLPYGQPRDSADVFQLCDDFRELYRAGKFVDFTVEAIGGSFMVHKTILVARSPFFAELFELDGDFCRKKVTVNASAIAVNDVLLYLYGGEFKKLDVPAMIEVFHIAQAFRVKCLIYKCSSFLETNLTVENAAAIITAATTYGAVGLKNAAVRYLVSRCGRVLNSNEWREILEREVCGI